MFITPGNDWLLFDGATTVVGGFSPGTAVFHVVTAVFDGANSQIYQDNVPGGTGTLSPPGTPRTRHRIGGTGGGQQTDVTYGAFSVFENMRSAVRVSTSIWSPQRPRLVQHFELRRLETDSLRLISMVLLIACFQMRGRHHTLILLQ